MPQPATAGATTTEQRAGLGRLRSQQPAAQVDFDQVTGAPKFISAGGEFLTSTNGQDQAISSASAVSLTTNDRHLATKAFLAKHHQLFGHGAEALDKARVKREFETPHNGLKTVVWEQQVDGIPVFEALLISHTTRRGELVNLSSQFLPDPDAAASRGAQNKAQIMAAPAVSAHRAVLLAAKNIGEEIQEDGLVRVQEDLNASLSLGPEKQQAFASKLFKGNAGAKLIWLPISRDELRLCWDVILMSRARGEMFRELVDVQTGEPLLRRCLTDYLSDATYRVFTSDSPSPFSPGWSSPNTAQPVVISRSLVTLPALDTNASPAGWINDGGNETRGNNVDAHTDRDANNLADLPRPQGSPFRVFDFPLDLTQAPAAYPNAAVVQLFYWNNWMHDKLYELGFTEAAGNFQSNNFSRGGLGNDAVLADAQDGSGIDNANFSTPPDGFAGRMQMYVFTGPNPDRDGDFDAEVILHEYTHGLSNRRVGGGVGLKALQSAGMGEGWSDFYALSLLSEPGDDANGVYASGGYASYLLHGLTQNYYFGIRRYPYCTDTNKNPLTFKDIDPTKASSHAGVPRNPFVGSTSASEVHNMGEVWCVTLWEARANLVNKYGWAAGNQLMLQLVTDGMNLSPANPNFLQARNAILQADTVDTGGANQYELWSAFAKRGMGSNATSPSSSTSTGVVEAYNIPLQPLRIFAPASATEGDGVLAGAGLVQLPFLATSNVIVTLSSSRTSEATVPPTITIPIGESNGVFDVTIVDDLVLDGTQISAITASALGYATVTTNLTVFDNETATLSVLLPAAATEGQGTVQGTVQSSAAPATNVLVSLSSSDTTEIQVPASVNFSAGQTSVVFTATIVDDIQIDGPQIATVTAHMQNWTDGATNITVLDNENLNLVVTLPSSAGESAGVLTNGGSVRISGTLTTNQVVSLMSSAPDRLIVPATVTIFAGQISNRFDVTVVDNSVQEGGQSVLVTASATGFNDGTVSIFILEDDTPPVITIQPASLVVPAGSAASLSVTASGGLPLSYQWSFNGTNLDSATNAALTLANVQFSDAGIYAVVVTNTFGSTTSSNASLAVVNVPIITSFSPTSGAVGTTVNISGCGFDSSPASNTVYFGAVKAGIISASPTNLTVTVPAGATYAAITVTVNGLTAYANQPFMPTFVGDGSGITISSFAPRLDLAAGNNAYRVVIADLDGDGKPDLVVVNYVGNSISLYRNLSTNGPITAASFAPRVDLATPANPLLLALADVDGDGRLDVIVSDTGADLVSVFLNTSNPGNLGPNSFTARMDYATGSRPQGIEVRDIDGDGKPDLLVANSGGETVSILRNTSIMGTLTTNSFAPKVDVVTGGGCDSVVVGDLDGDGKPDVATANGGNNTLSVLRNLSSPGSLAFATKTDFAVPSGPIHLAIGDLDGDGKPDLTVACYLPQSLSVLRNLSTVGSNAFAPRMDFPLGGRGHTPTIADLDGDGKADLAVVTELSSLLSVFRNLSTSGNFTNSSLAGRVDFSTGYNAWGLSAGDLDGDGRPELVFCNQYDSTLSIYQNRVPFGLQPVITAQPSNQVMAVGGTITFSVLAGGTPPLRYQWSLNSTTIAGETNASLTLTNLQFTNAGDYSVTVTNLYGATVSSNASLTVINILDHFVWSQIPSPRFANTPFAVTIQARDPANNVFTNFTDPVILATTNGVPINPSVSANFSQGAWTGLVTVPQVASNLVLRADDGMGHFGLANSINVVALPSLAMTRSGSYLYIFWPIAPSGFVLESSANLLPPQWISVSDPPVQIGNQFLQPVQMTVTNQFFRLRFTNPY